MGTDEQQNGDAEGAKVKYEDLLGLWKYFQDHADTVKERQWTIGTWILTLLSGVAAFAVSQEMLSITENGISVNKPLPTCALGVVGILICAYGLIVIRQYGAHIQRNWDRADRVKEQIDGLDHFWRGHSLCDKHSSQNLPRDSQYLTVVILGFLILFLGVGFFSALVVLLGLLIPTI